jgi:ATP-dependent helicase/DNAse subunit B
MTFVEVQNRAEEVRAGLRWLKARLVRDQMAPAEVALIARDLTPYRHFIEEIAGEFGLTLHLREGLNLAANPAVSALMSLLALPLAGHTEAAGNWGRRPLIEAWRSPYFENLAPEMTPRDADRLDAVARQGRVIQGLDQWREALARQLDQANHREAGDSTARLDDEEEFNPSDRLAAAHLLALQTTFEAFVARLTLPTPATLRQFAAFVEDLMGDDPMLAASNPSSSRKSKNQANSLDIVKRAQAVTGTKPRDIAALRAFKDVLRGLVLAESSLRQSSGQANEAKPISYEQVYDDLHSAVQGAIYYLPPPVELAGAIPVLSVLNARGLSFRAVALIGLAEGEFPRSEREDILLREEDRAALQQAGLTTLDTRLRGDEITFFYQAVTRAREKLLLCRPYLADDGQTWEPSPYWQELRRLFDPPVQHLRPEDPLVLTEVASPQEFTQTLARFELVALDLNEPTPAANLSHVLHSAAVLNARLAAEPQSPFEGDLTGLSDRLAAVYGPEHVWSASRLEAYGLCPHHFWLWQDLALEPRQPPVEGFDIFILGGMYHEILEEVYREAGAEAGGERLLELLPPIAQNVFDAAPETYGFRPTPLWAMQRRELEQIVAQTLTALVEATADNTPLAQEQVFGLRDQPPLVIKHNGNEIRVRGFIDRVDQDAAGHLCIIDYKSGSTPIAARDLSEGRRLQIALYALAAQDALGLGEIADGFYWHIGSAKPSSLTLDKFDGGVAAALKMAIAHAFEHVAGIRAGRFAPKPPDGGCPGHCPGASFCWRYQAKGY